MTSNMAEMKTKKLTFVIFLIVLVNITGTIGRIHHLHLEADSRPKVTLSTFGFLKQGTFIVNVTDFVVAKDGKHIPNNTFGFTLDVSSSSGAGGYMEDYAENCILKELVDNVIDEKEDVLSIIFFRMDLANKILKIERRGQAMKNVIISEQNMTEFWKSRKVERRDAPNPLQSRMSDTYLFPVVDKQPREKRDTLTDPLPMPGSMDKQINVTTEDPTEVTEGTQETPISKDKDAKPEKSPAKTAEENGVENAAIITEIPIYRKGPEELYSFYFLLAVTEEAQEGMYNLNFHNCLNKDEHGNTKVTFTVDIVEDNNGNYLSAGSMPLPTLYFVLSGIYIITAVVWNTVLCKSKDSVFKMHYLMMVVVFVKSLSCLFHAMNYHFIQKEGIHEEAWAVLFYIAYLTRGALLFITIILIGSGWAFIKHVLSDREKKLFLIFIPLQILDNIAWIIVEESEEGQSQYTVWKEIFILIDLLCCGAILFPVVWSIRHLQEASRADGKEELSLTKLKLFRQFYIMVVCYIYFTRIIVYLLKMTVPFKYEWLNELFRELGTVLFFVVTGYKFRPATDNPYLQVPTDDDEEMEMDTVIVGQSGTLDTVKKVNQGSKDGQTAPKLRESSHEYD